MAIYIKNKKGMHSLSKEEFRNYMYELWQEAQARKAARTDMETMREDEKEK